MRRTLAAAAAVLALSLAACSDDPEPDFTPPEPTSPSATEPTETETASQAPGPGSLGPEDTVRAWVEARDRLMLEGDSSEVDALSAHSCTTCADQLDPLKKVHRAGGRFETKGWRVVSAVVDSEDESRARVTAGLAMAGGTTWPSANAQPVEYGSERRIAQFTLAWLHGSWVVRMIGFLQ